MRNCLKKAQIINVIIKAQFPFEVTFVLKEEKLVGRSEHFSIIEIHFFFLSTPFLGLHLSWCAVWQFLDMVKNIFLLHLYTCNVFSLYKNTIV